MSNDTPQTDGHSADFRDKGATERAPGPRHPSPADRRAETSVTPKTGTTGTEGRTGR